MPNSRAAGSVARTLDRSVDAARQALATGDLAAAEAFCRDAVSASAGDARPWAMLSEIALRRHRTDVALACAEKAVALDRTDALGHVMRAKCLMLAGEHQAALAAVGIGVRHARDAAAQDALGALYSLLGDPAAARPLFLAAARAVPENAQFRYNLAAAERMLGKLNAAEANCDRLIADHPHFYPAYALRADVRTQTASRNHAAEIEALLATGVSERSGEVSLRFALAKEYDDLGEYDRAFRQLQSASALHRQGLPYRPGAAVAEIERIIQAPVPRAGAGFTGDAPIFVVGLPRSGTTLVERTLAGHDEIVSAGELGILPMLLARATGAPDFAGLGRAYCAAARARGIPPSHRLIDKFPDNYRHCGLIHAALPHARIIVVRRQPMDSCLALYRTHFAGTYPFSYDLTELADHYRAFDRMIAHWRAVLPPTALIEVAYEDMVEQHEAQSRRLIAFLGLAWQDRVLDFQAGTAPCATASAVQIRQSLYRSSIGKWRHYAAHLEPLRKRLFSSPPALPTRCG